MNLYRTNVRRKIIVEHDFYGCPCECCGTKFVAIEIVNGEDYERKTRFEFAHFEPDEVKLHIEKYVKVSWPEWVGAPIEIGDLRCPAA